MNNRIEEQPYDDRHNTPPRRQPADSVGETIKQFRSDLAEGLYPVSGSALKIMLDELERLRGDEAAAEMPERNRTWNLSVEEAERFIRACEVRARVTTKLGAAHQVLLEELERLRNGETTIASELQPAISPKPGLTYDGPDGWWVRPAEKANVNAMLPVLSILELRVLAAHLSTALDNVTAALLEKGAVST